MGLEKFPILYIYSNMDIQNYMERMIGNLLDGLIKEYPEYRDIEPFREEVIAFSLNKAEPLYSTTEPLYSTTDLGHAVIEARIVDSGFRSKITAIVIEAIEKVRANPRG